MSRTRQLRLSEKTQIRKKLSDSVGKIMHIVLTDSRALVGNVAKVDTNSISLLNMRQKAMTILFDDISEIYFDTPT